MHDVRRDFGGFMSLPREDAEDYLYWLAGVREQDVIGGTGMVCLFPLGQVPAEDSMNWLDTHFIGKTRCLEEFEFAPPSHDLLTTQLTCRENSTDAFVWSSWTARDLTTDEKGFLVGELSQATTELDSYWAAGSCFSDVFATLMHKIRCATPNYENNDSGFAAAESPLLYGEAGKV